MTGLKFAKSHEWVAVQAETATIGISDYAQSHLGDVVFVELPKVGDAIKQSAQFGTIESTKAASELYSPLSGVVVETNGSVVSNPQLVNQSPENLGWMIKVKVTNPAELDNLMDEMTYKEFVEQE
ncbi:MAG: glycine cleavage system protein GcvH [Candidatus Omnitrophica bacterium]|nr:glycine cleavage system protein GcvH [Candidatus Omnitrophota bacterium]MBU2044694.1 glycine cleavage system protein GcvH [Candidatus Omnitrophota bacterium]MBU2474256.1 glycine cleavage system protein GcvH [Candidatus Omnitrophota bacterium]